MKLRNAIVSVSNKQNLYPLVSTLLNKNINVFATGGTKTYLNNYFNEVKCTSELTGMNELCGGRVKTLHPNIFAGILGRDYLKDEKKELEDKKIPFIDLVVTNLYPYSEHKGDMNYMDIGGHSMIRSAIKNHSRVFSLTDPNQYDKFINFLYNPCNESNYKKQLAKQSLAYLQQYDESILSSFIDNTLKHGLNKEDKPSSVIHSSDRNIITLNGSPSYINYLDALYSYNLVLDILYDIKFPAFASFKHNSPAGVAIGSTPQEAFFRARNADPKSSFGDFLACNMTIDRKTALLISKEVSDGIIAPKYTEDALDILQKKKKGKYLVLKAEYNKPWKNDEQVRQMFGTTLYQTRSNQQLDKKIINELECEKYKSAIVAFHTAKYTQSNSVVIATDGVACGIGAGQQNRVDCIEIAGKKANEWLSRQFCSSNELVMVSDGFLPFKDNIETANKYNVKTILQPGGSIRDKEIIQSAKDKDINMIMTNQRLFLH